ncbi:MAG TPA: hypothetical protein VM532_04350, partial [Burkholderiales bacterium]|nr:hypothetical protein [Burkholderiales bacterium]
AASIDRALCANPQYAYARSLGQLDEARAMHCPDLCHRWHLHASKTGRRIGDVKPPVLARVMDADFFKASPA